MSVKTCPAQTDQFEIRPAIRWKIKNGVCFIGGNYKYKGKVKEKEKRIDNIISNTVGMEVFSQDGKINNSVSNPPVNVTFFCGGGEISSKF
jgi:hypothetical protein